MIELVIDDKLYELLDLGGGRIRWETQQVPTQRGDGSRPVPHELRFEGGFGASKRYTDGQGRQTAPTHADYRQNWDSRYLGLNCAAPAITFLDLSAIARAAAGFRLGGSAFGRLGGGFSGALGGGTFTDVPAAIETFGDFVYVSAGGRTFVIDPDAVVPNVEEVREHGSGARVRSSDVFDNELVIACGASSDAEGATQPRTSSFPTQWETFAGVKMSAYRTGKAGRLFSARTNLVFNVLAGQNPSVIANYLPSTGEVLTDATEPVRALEEYSRALVGSTAREVRTFDPDAGFFSRSLIPRGRASPSDFDGFGMITIGDMLLVAFTQSVWLFRIGEKPELAGPELLDQNESPYIGGEPGIPDRYGDWIVWPYFFPTTGDSVIFWIRPRRPGEPGIGPLVWQDLIYLPGRECRVVHYWGGTSTVKPRLIFGAGTTANPEIVGHVGLGRGGGPDIFDTDAIPAASATLFAADDDFGLPSTIKEVERVEFPQIMDADGPNYLVVSVSEDGGTEYTDLVTVQGGGPDSSRIQATGFQTVFAPIYDPIEGVKLKTKLAITQDSVRPAQYAIETLSAVGYWGLGEPSGTDALDAVNGNDGAVTIGAGVRNAAALDDNGDGSIEFDALLTKVEVTDVAVLQNVFDGGGTIFGVFDADSDGESSQGHIIDRVAWDLRISDESSGNFRMEFNQVFAPTPSGQWQTAVDIPINATIIFVLTYDSDSTTNNPTLYLWNGSSQATLTVGSGLTESSSPANSRVSDIGFNVVIGNNTGQTATFDGHIDEIGMSTTVATAAQAVAWINAVRSRPGFLTIRGFPQMYVSERPLMTEQVTTLLDVHPNTIETATDLAGRIKGHVAGKKVEVGRGTATDDDMRWAKIGDVRAITVEVRDRDNQRQDRSAVQLVYREVQVD